MEPLPLYILAGGKSSRFGRDKARVQVDGRPLILHIASVLSPCTTRITVVADFPDKYSDLGLNTIADAVTGLGPIGGLLTALEHCREDDWLLLTSCDCVGVKAHWVQLLAPHRHVGVQAVAFREDRWEPMLGLYHASMRPEVEGAIARGELALWQLLGRIAASAVPLPHDWSATWQINTPAELDAYRAVYGCPECRSNAAR